MHGSSVDQKCLGFYQLKGEVSLISRFSKLFSVQAYRGAWKVEEPSGNRLIFEVRRRRRVTCNR